MLEELFSKVKSRMKDPSELPPSVKMSVPADLLSKCPKCKAVVFMEQVKRADNVCPQCGHHGRLTARQRIAAIADEGTFNELDAAMTSLNPIDFPGYEEKVRSAAAATGLNEAVVTGRCEIGGQRCILGVMDPHFMMASMGSVVGEKIARAFETAAAEKTPVIIFTASGGARMQEGVISLMQMAKTAGAAAKCAEAGVLYISVLCDPTTGGVTASFAMLGDIILAEPGALIGFAGRRVIEGTIKEKLPDNFQTAEFLLESGFLDAIVERRELRTTLARLLRLHKGEV